jgi:LmbE family N-acetylglucosaminyl deacetylase
MRPRLLLIFLLLITIVFPISARVKSSIPDAARLQILMKKLTVVGNVLYVGAHPDDENSEVLSYLSMGRLLRTGYLALNRGEGGQNLIGTEQGDLLGIIRTQELLAARRVDDAQQFFTRAVDFGFSKSPQESLDFWGKQDVLSDVVWVFRKFRPDVVITRFPTVGETHGHHLASSILAQEAFDAAGDPSKFPEQLKYVDVWKSKRIVWNSYNWGNQKITDAEKATLISMETGDYDALLGKSYTELAGISRSNHKSQGFGDSEDRGKITNYFRHTAGEPAQKDLFDGIDLTWNRIPEGAEIGKILKGASDSFDPAHPDQSIPALLKAHHLLEEIKKNPWADEKKQDLLDAIRGCSGLWLEAISADESATRGSNVQLTLKAINRSQFALKLNSISISGADGTSAVHETSEPQDLQYNVPYEQKITVKIAEDAAYTQPYWLQERNGRPFAKVSDPFMIGLPENPPALLATFEITAGSEHLTFTEPVMFRKIDPVRGEIYSDFTVVPDVMVNVLKPIVLSYDSARKLIPLEIVSSKADVAGELKLNLPEGWTCDPESQNFLFTTKNEVQRFIFAVKPTTTAQAGEFRAVATVGTRTISEGRIVIDYPHIAKQTIFPPAKGKLIQLDLKKVGEKIGYIMGSGDAIPDALREIGYNVTLLSDEDLSTQDFNFFDAMIVGIRAYNTRPALKDFREKLNAYVNQGGTLVVQYQTPQESVTDSLGPYPFKISRKRVSVETAPVTILKTDHAMVRFPNQITEKDFEGWIQERGLYFSDQWDPKYETIFSSQDPNEQPLAGGTLYTRYGKGVYIFSGYSWFRELPAGVPGAYRIFVNMISAGKNRGK